MNQKILDDLVALAAETSEQMRRTAERAARHHKEREARLSAEGEP